MTVNSGRSPHAARRLLIGLVVGVLVGLATPRGWPPEARVLLGWVAFTLTVMAQLWPLMMRAGPARTRELATREDDSRALAGTITMTAALVSLIGVVFLLSDAHDARGTRELLLTALAVGTVATSWLLVQTEYTLHYARRYYRDGRGVLFPHGEGSLEEPTYWDFAYLSVTIGMTCHTDSVCFANNPELHRPCRLHVRNPFFSYSHPLGWNGFVSHSIGVRIR